MEAFFEDLSEKLSFPVDQVRYLCLFVCSFPLAFMYRTLLSPRAVPLVVRHVFSASLGLLFAFICFKKWETILLLVFVGVCYLLVLLTPPTVCHWYTTAFAFTSILSAHTYRMYVDYEGWHQDFTGPLMILVQRVTSVSCAVHDGLGRKDADLNEDQRDQKLSKRPSVLEYTSYTFNFISILAGPMYSFKDYMEFVSGKNLVPLSNPNKYAKAKEHSHAPSPFIPVLIKTVQAVGFLICTFILVRFTPDAALDPSLFLPVRMIYVSFAAFRVRCLYYFVFILTDAICNTAGLGFSGYDSTGSAKWDLVTNVHPSGLELGRNLREQVQAWNIGTVVWLKRCVYERISFFPTVTTWIVSALWHGLYPGYHLSFSVFALANVTARKVRKVFWKRYQSPRWVKLTYDCVTWAATSFGRDFAALPFILLTFEKTLILWSSYYYLPLIMCVSLFVFLPSDVKTDKQTLVNGQANHHLLNNNSSKDE